MYRIANWDELYEVNTSGRKWKEGQEKYCARLKWVRSPVHGRKWGRRYRMLLESNCGRVHPEGVLGIFHKFREFVADLPPEHRTGALIYDDDGTMTPYTIETLAIDSGFKPNHIEKAIDVLISIGWMVQDGAELRKVAESCGKLRRNAIITEQNRIEYDTEDSIGDDTSPSTLGEWKKRLRKEANKNAVIMDMLTTLFPDKEPPTFPRLGKAVKRCNDDEYFISELWKLAARPPSGSVIDYMDKIKSRAIEPVPAANPKPNPLARLPVATDIAHDIMINGGDFTDATSRLAEEGITGIVVDKAWEDAKLKRKQDESLDVCLHPESSNHECEQCWIEHPERHDKWGTRANCKAKTRRE